MKILKKLLFFLIGLVLVLVLVALFLPKSVKVERSTQINNTPRVVYDLVSNYKKFNEWSPWADLDPNAKYVFSGPDQGVGAKMTWESDMREVGSGTQEITEVVPGKHVKVDLDFGKNGSGKAFYDLTPKDSGTHVTWGFTTDFGYNPIGRYMGLFFDKWIGPDYEKGLASLKVMAEKLPKVDYSDLIYQVTDVSAKLAIAKEIRTDPNPAAISQGLGAGYGEILAFIGSSGLQMAGQPITINRSYGETYVVDAAIPVTEEPAAIDTTTGLKFIKTYAGKVLKVTHKGAYGGMANTYEKINELMFDEAMTPAGVPWEEYVSDPGSTPENELITFIYFPISTK